MAASNAAGTSAASAAVAVTPLASNSTALAAGYKQANWASNLSVTYPTECSMTIATNGQPSHAIDSFYLEPPIGTCTTVVAKAAVSGMALVMVPYTAGTRTSFMTFNTCPTKAAATTTATSGGAIGLIIFGPTLFNATEGENGKAAALSDNVFYSFRDSTGTARAASFIDSCNGHPTPSLSGNDYHYHGLSSCITAQVDTAGGPSHLIGVAADGFPIYGNKDISGNTVTVDQLDACNGITSATPEFPGGVHHYVLPAGVTNFQSSLRCYSGTVTARQVLAMQSMGVCKVPLTALATPFVLPGKSTPPGTRQRPIRLAV
ncbi:MAG: YHYH protein [Polaromonas sp.]|nr:YHYH protein [Polaromonas sp.]